ncbi:cupin domain-containing protein [Vibrio nitrifigilis]|uniref:Cupin domain-containing protein n=1 Tax=Vibrio nitrifigilis TaxID=2789781 RepID=A0ABS0GCV4_9VIBR|nr:cupin domain-containing protein [Vibrio nitrifigilis]MBF9000200.1 cupin domain-containing protein [Vibrio nitrifigilis]
MRHLTKGRWATSLLTVPVLIITTLTINNAVASQQVYRGVNQAEFDGSTQYFSGKVHVKMAFPSNDIAHYSGAYVTFAKGARTAWHSHPAGQHMIVTAGTAITVTRDGTVLTFHPGEAVWCPPGIDHWHGATTKDPMTHFVVTAANAQGKNVVWKEQVADDDYAKANRLSLEQ